MKVVCTFLAFQCHSQGGFNNFHLNSNKKYGQDTGDGLSLLLASAF